MNREDIIRMAREAHGPITAKWWDMDVASLERFAALVASAERKQIIEIAESSEFNRIRGEFSPTSTDLVNCIKARGQHD